MTTVIDRSSAKSAYDLPPPTYDPDLVLVTKGTGGGEVLRRYWQPVALASEVKDIPLAVRALGEDLVLFRTGQGEYGLVYPRCTHRGANLLFGRVENDGLACCYHGWKFAPDGTCLDQPCEPGGGQRKDLARQPWYPVREQYGLIFAYMGPIDRIPPLPRFDVLEDVPEGNEIVADGNSIGSGGPEIMPCNWFQTHDNVMDPTHVIILHKDQFPPEMTSGFDELNFEPDERTIYGTSKKLLSDGATMRFSAELVFPNARIIPDPFLSGMGRANWVNWSLPVDDTTTRIFTAMNVPKGAVYDSNPPAYNGKRWHDLTAEEHQRHPGDFEAQVGQGAITFHSEEHLATADRGIVLFRRMFKKAVEAVRAGGDPPNGFGQAQVVHTVRAAFQLDMPQS